MGVPSKYCAFPDVSLGITWTVTLNLARRVSPHRTKHERQIVSTRERKPRQNATTAGAMPKEIYDKSRELAIVLLNGQLVGKGRQYLV